MNRELNPAAKFIGEWCRNGED